MIDLSTLDLPPGFGIVICAGQLPEPLPFGISPGDLADVEDPVVIVATLHREFLCHVVVRRADTDQDLWVLIAPAIQEALRADQN